ncbi:hypothetical protein [Microbacterium sp. LWH3-1.2]|uniref:hypothetical protein n=1 Tax=Microbacterium sp. LWH3-1.2 TaxID=3135256 RepID=UPI0034235617
MLTVAKTVATVDWSSFWPDMIVAIFTGLFVAAAVIFAERQISRRAALRESADAQRRVVTEADRWMRAADLQLGLAHSRRHRLSTR